MLCRTDSATSVSLLRPTDVDELEVALSTQTPWTVPTTWEEGHIWGDRQEDKRQGCNDEWATSPGSTAVPPSRHTGTVISIHTATHAQIAEPLFCNFHNEAFGIIIKLREREEAWPSLRKLRSVLLGRRPSSPGPHGKEQLGSRRQSTD